MLSPLTTHWELIKVAMEEGSERVCKCGCLSRQGGANGCSFLWATGKQSCGETSLSPLSVCPSQRCSVAQGSAANPSLKQTQTQRRKQPSLFNFYNSTKQMNTALIFSSGPTRTSALVVSGQLRRFTTHKYLIWLRESLGTQVVKYLHT